RAARTEAARPPTSDDAPEAAARAHAAALSDDDGERAPEKPRADGAASRATESEGVDSDGTRVAREATRPDRADLPEPRPRVGPEAPAARLLPRAAPAGDPDTARARADDPSPGLVEPVPATAETTPAASSAETTPAASSAFGGPAGGVRVTIGRVEIRVAAPEEPAPAPAPRGPALSLDDVLARRRRAR
ncbi:MAG TPA: hypothetical protein VHJ34_06375, partial [Actinomycetota bacterium]|nr:hypothetical protein [Actinomycetota bacterium]